MNTFYTLTLFWLLPSMVIFLAFTSIGRAKGDPIEKWDWKEETAPLLFSAVFYPLGLLALVASTGFWDALIKERKWWGQK